MFQFSQTTFLFWCHHGEPGNKSRRDSKGLIHPHRAFQSIPEPPFFPAALSPFREMDDSGSLDGRQPWATLSSHRASGAWWGELRQGWGWGWGWRAAPLWHFCTVSRWGKRTLICSMSRVLCAKGTSRLASTQRLAVSLGPLNEACVISLRATRDGNCSPCASSSTVFCWQKLSLGL